MTPSRIATFDILKGIGILLMIIGHSTGKIPYLRDFIFSFHMPLFFLVSGYFFRPAGWKELWAKNSKRLLVPYLFTALLILVHMLIYQACHGGDVLNVLVTRLRALVLGSGTPRVFGMGPAIGALWFLLALFWSHLFLNLALRTRFPFLFCMGLAALSFSLHGVVFLPLSIQPGFSGTFFLFIGYQVRQSRLLEPLQKELTPARGEVGNSPATRLPFSAWYASAKTRIQSLPASWLARPSVSGENTTLSFRLPPFLSTKRAWTVILFAAWFTCFNRGKLEMSCDYYRLWYFDMIGAVAACWFVYLLSRHMDRSMPRFNRFFSFFGRYSLVVLCFHQYETVNIPWGYLTISSWGDYRLPLLWVLKILFAFLMVELVLHVSFLRRIFQIR